MEAKLCETVTFVFAPHTGGELTEWEVIQPFFFSLKGAALIKHIKEKLQQCEI